MDFEWTEDQLEFRDSVVEFARARLNDDLIGRDLAHGFSREAWKQCADMGIQGLSVPEAYGGQGADPLTAMLALEALGYGCRDNGLLFSLNAHMWSCSAPIVRFGSEEQKTRYLPGLCDGSAIGVQTMTEPGSGSDAFALATTADRTDDGWVLNGSKTFITNAPVADVFVVFASSNKKAGAMGLSAFIVPREIQGLTVGTPTEKMGLRTSPMADVYFEDCRIPADAILGKPGGGMALFNHSMDWERGCILASNIGTMQRQLEQCVAYAKERKQFGQPIGKFQAVSHRIVDMEVRLQAARLLLYHEAWLRREGKPTATASATVKLFVSEAFLQSSLDAVQIHGGYGYMTEMEIERDVRDAIGGRLYSGTSDIQRNLIARKLGL